METGRVCSKIALFSVESRWTLRQNKNSCLRVIAKTSSVWLHFWSELLWELCCFRRCVHQWCTNNFHHCMLNSSGSTPSVTWMYSLVLLSLRLYSNHKIVSTTVLWIPFIYFFLEDACPKVFASGILCQRWVLGHHLWDFCDLCRFSCLAPTVSLWTPLVIPLWPRVHFFVRLYFRCVLESFLLKNAIGILSWVITTPNCAEEASVYIAKGFKKLGKAKTISFAKIAYTLSKACRWIGSHCQGFFLVLFILVVFVSPHSPTRSVRGARISLPLTYMSR